MFKLDEYDKHYAELQEGYEIQEVEPINGKRMFDVVKTAEPTAEEQAQFEIDSLRRFLADTDYVVIKIAEGVATPQDYADVIAQRQSARARIREMEK